MGCCSAKRKANASYDDGCYVCESAEPYDRNIYTLNLMKCYPKHPKMKGFINEPYYNPSSPQNTPHKNLNYISSCRCCCRETGYDRLDSMLPNNYYESMSTEDEVGEPKRSYSSKMYNSDYPSEEESCVSYEGKSSDSYLSFTCKCIRSKTPKHNTNENDYKQHNDVKHIGIQKESEKCCTVMDQYDDYIKKMEKSWYCCYNILNEIKELLSEIDAPDKEDLTEPSTTIEAKIYGLCHAEIPECNGILKNDIEELDCEDHFKSTNI